LTGVTQNAQGTSQTRSFGFDGFSRMTSESNPETGLTSYTFDSDPTCGTSNGDLVKRVDAVGNVTCYHYDALHRLTSITYPSGSYAGVTPSKYYVYDSASISFNGTTNMSYSKNRLAEAYTCTSPCTTKITDLAFSYSTRGETTDVYESTPHSSGWYHVGGTYWANGARNQLSTNLSGLPTITYGADGEGRVSTVGAASGQNPVSSTAYTLASQPKDVILGSGDGDHYTYDSNTGRMTQYKFTVGATPQDVIGALTWNPNGSLGSLGITDPFNTSNNQTCAYAHDDLSRIVSANCGSIWSQTFGFDPFGNINKSGSLAFQPTYTSSTNRIATIPGAPNPTYDGNGNLLTINDGTSHTYLWDTDGKQLGIDSLSATYDALGRMVELNNSGAFTEIVYELGSDKLALMSSQTLQKAFIAIPSGTAVYTASGLSYYRHSDWLGSSRFSSTASTRTMFSSTAYGPYGEVEVNSESGTPDRNFTGQNQDVASGFYDFLLRRLSATQGRWISPDPAGIAAVDKLNPQTWNRYAYVSNSPLEYVDPLGLEDVPCPPGYPPGSVCKKVTDQKCPDGTDCGGGGPPGSGPGGGAGGSGGGSGSGDTPPGTGGQGRGVDGNGGSGNDPASTAMAIPLGAPKSCGDQLADMYNVINAWRPSGSSDPKGLFQRMTQFLKSQPGTRYADPGHVERYENLQRNLNKKISDYRNSGCGEPPADITQWATTPLPNPLPSSGSQFSVPDWVVPAAVITGATACAIFVPGCVEVELATAPAW
jgi:RHS repeat-associated protein